MLDSRVFDWQIRFFLLVPSCSCFFSSSDGTKSAIQHEPVTMPPIIKQMTREQTDAIVDTPLQADFPCPSQTVEHGVATTTQCVKRRRKESTQLACVLQTVEARAQQPHVVTHKRYRKDYVNISKTVKKQ